MPNVWDSNKLEANLKVLGQLALDKTQGKKLDIHSVGTLWVAKSNFCCENRHLVSLAAGRGLPYSMPS